MGLHLSFFDLFQVRLACGDFGLNEIKKRGKKGANTPLKDLFLVCNSAYGETDLKRTKTKTDSHLNSTLDECC